MWTIHQYDELPSTQTLARSLFDEAKAGHGDVFIAAHQSSGRGQYVWRMWDDEPGANLLLSFILTEVPPAVCDMMQFLVGLSVLSTIRSILDRELRSFDHNRVRLKWPNDILIDGKKVAGVLSEAIWAGQALKGVIIGIGINVNQDSFAAPVASKATALKQILSETVPLQQTRDLLLATIEYTLKHYSDRAKLCTDLRSELEWMESLSVESATTPDGTSFSSLTIKGISDAGALVVQTSNGVEHVLQSATLHFTA
jgi:BirA family biotin operon repressor/biotin-[acetyl-CoA-carboxylase] ligase